MAAPTYLGAQEWVAARQWATRFADATADATEFTLTNLSYDTDGGTPVVKATTPASLSSILTKTSLHNFNVRIRYKAAARSGGTLSEAIHYAVGRHSDLEGRSMHAIDAYNSGGFVWLRSMIGGVNGTANLAFIAKATLSIDNENDDDYRFLELEVTEDVLKMRTWMESATIPAWQFIRRSRAFLNAEVDLSLAADDPMSGPVGFAMITSGALVQELVVTELLRVSENLIRYPMFDVRESYGLLHPVYWTPNRAAAGGETISVAQVADWQGRTRSAMRIISPGTELTSLCWTSSLVCKRGRMLSGAIARTSGSPYSSLGQEIEVTLVSKGTSVAIITPSSLYGGVGLGACFVIKYYSADTGAELGELESGVNPHYTYLGPTLGGRGTWNWHRAKVRMQIMHPHRVGYVSIFMGLHDRASGTLDMMDPEVRVVG